MLSCLSLILSSSSLLLSLPFPLWRLSTLLCVVVVVVVVVVVNMCLPSASSLAATYPAGVDHITITGMTVTTTVMTLAIMAMGVTITTMPTMTVTITSMTVTITII